MGVTAEMAVVFPNLKLLLDKITKLLRDADVNIKRMKADNKKIILQFTPAGKGERN